MEFNITIPFDPSTDEHKLKEVSKHFDVEVKKQSGDYWQLSTSDPANFFWLGINVNQKLQQ